MNSILVTGGTGTLGHALIPKLFGAFQAKRVRVLSRGEHTQMAMAQKLQDDRIDYLIGDVRDEERVWKASKGCEMIFHLAAVKSVDKVEYDPDEAVKTNILGTQNVINAALKHGIPRSIFTSTDKAVEPVNVYGTTKLAAERIFVTSNAYSGANGPRFSAVRYGNVFGSQGSVIPKWQDLIAKGITPKVTSLEMTRFWILVEDAADFIINSAKAMDRGEVFIPKMKSASMKQLFEVMADHNAVPEVIGRRPGEKLHEKLFGHDELEMMTQTKDSFIRWPLNPQFPINMHGMKVEHELTSFTAERFSNQELYTMLEAIK